MYVCILCTIVVVWMFGKGEKRELIFLYVFKTPKAEKAKVVDPIDNLTSSSFVFYSHSFTHHHHHHSSFRNMNIYSFVK